MLVFKQMLTCVFAAAIGFAMTWGEAASAAITLELTTNGGFETGDFTGWTQFEVTPGDQMVISSNPSSGTFAGQIANGAPTSNSLFKQANLGVGVVTTGQMVDISFDARGTYAVPGGVAFAEFFSELAGGGVSSSEILGGGPLAINSDPNVWTTFNFTAITGPDVSGGVTLQLGATTGPAGGTTMVYDNVSVSVQSTAIPEPGSVALLCLCGMGILWRRHRHQRAAKACHD